MNDPIHTAILIKMGNLIGRVSLGNGEQLRSIHSSNLDDALKKYESHGANVIVVNGNIEKDLPKSFVEMFQERYPDFRVPVIVVHLGLPPHRLTIYEWNETDQIFAERTSEPKKLGEEIETLCFQVCDWKEHIPELREIGFASNLRQGSHSFHIQTEVMTSRGVKIKTTVLSGGTVVESKVLVDPNPGRHVVEQTKETAERQHNSAVSEVEQGKYEDI